MEPLLGVLQLSAQIYVSISAPCHGGVAKATANSAGSCDDGLTQRFSFSRVLDVVCGEARLRWAHSPLDAVEVPWRNVTLQGRGRLNCGNPERFCEQKGDADAARAEL